MLLNANGRWETAACSLSLPHACVSLADEQVWQLSAASAPSGQAACPSGFVFGVPAVGYLNSLLAQRAGSQRVWLNYRV